MDSKDHAAVDQLDALILKGEYSKAYSKAYDYIYHGEKAQAKISAEVWLRIVLVRSLLKWDTTFVRIRLRDAPDYTEVMEGDFRLKEMERSIKTGNFARARGLRRQIVQFHRHDPERMLEYWGVVALLHELSGYPVKAQRTRAMIKDHQRKLNLQAAE